jgi:hypothetical protein
MMVAVVVVAGLAVTPKPYWLSWSVRNGRCCSASVSTCIDARFHGSQLQRALPPPALLA